MTMATHVSSISVDKMRDKLLTLDEARTRLSRTEPLFTHPFTAGSKAIRFIVNEGWNDEVDLLKDTDPVDAYVVLGDTVTGTQEYQLTKEALLKAAVIVGPSKAYTSRAPAFLTQDALNYWYRTGKAGSDYQILTCNGLAAAVCKSTITPFSNLRILDAVLEGIEQKYGVGEVLVDYKFHHSLINTSMRLVVPDHRRNMLDTGVEDDTWSTGIEINNSQTGDGQTEIVGYLFCWTCTNGNTCVHNGMKWSRKSRGQGDEVYLWARDEIDAILGGLESELDLVQETVHKDLSGDFNVMAADIFKNYKIPLDQQHAIRERLVDEDRFTMYHLMQAITATANDADLKLKPHEVARLLRTGGDLPHQHSSRCSLGQLHLQD